MNNKIKLSTVLKIVIPLAVLIALLVVRFTAFNKEKFSLVRYAIVSVNGFNNIAEATVLVDDVGLYNAIVEDDATEEDILAYEAFVDSVSFDLDTKDGIANGDVIKITANYDEDKAKALGIRVDVTEREYKVSGLRNGTKLDLFEDVKIITGGISPYVYVTYLNESENEYLKGLEYSIDKTAGISIGDTITITCLIDEATAHDNGYYYESDVMEYTITTADKYIDDPQELDDVVMETLKTELTNLIIAETSDTTYHMAYKATGNKSYLYRDNNESAVNVQLDRINLANNATGFEQEHENYVLVFCKGDIALPKYTTDADPYDYVGAYFCFVYSDAILTRDGEFLMATNEPWERVVCGRTYEEALAAVEEQIGKGYTLQEYIQ